MNRNLAALIIENGTKLVTLFLQNKDLFHSPSTRSSSVLEMPIEEPEISREEIIESPDSDQPVDKASSIAAGCVPCSIGHLGTCTGLINEAMRFARSDGVQADEVINKVNICLDELNALERDDLRPEMIHVLPEWEKAIAVKALNLSRTTRHNLESFTDVDSLEATAAQLQTGRNEIGRAWFKEKLDKMTPEQKQALKDKLSAEIKKERDNGQEEKA